MKIKVFILVALVLCLTLSVGISFADVVTFEDFSNYDFIVYGADNINSHLMRTQSISVGNKSLALGFIYSLIDTNADIYVCTLTSTLTDGTDTVSVSQNLVATFINEFSEEYLFTLSDGVYIYIDSDFTYLIGILTNTEAEQPYLLSLSPLLVGYEKAVPVQSGLFVDAYNWFNDTFFSGEVPPLLESLSEEFSTIFAVLFVGCIVAIPLFLVWVLVKSVIAMSLFNR